MIMRYLPVFLLLFLAACEAHNFDRDKRQIIAKDQLRSQLRGNRSISITNFQEDTLANWPGITVAHPIRYSLDFVFKDSTGELQGKKAVVIFTPEGNDVLATEITDRPLTDK